jgi:NAD(P)-dependent dehydrogenase (short-subunit alcohol dehydrogenase family)
MKKTALVTGGARGIGLGISQRLIEEGYNIAVCGRSPENEVKTLDELKKTEAEILYCQCDISNSESRKAMIDKIQKHFKRLDALVNNAGIAPTERKDILNASEESFDKLINVNLKGPYFLTQLVANWMIEQKKNDSSYEGKIITVSSVSSTVASVNRGDYCISKAGLSMTTKLWAARLGEYGIPVYEIRPGIIATDMTSKVKDKYDKLIKDGLLVQSRWGTPEDIGKTAAMLLRGDMPYSTGSVLMVDGGLTLERL